MIGFPTSRFFVYSFFPLIFFPRFATGLTDPQSTKGWGIVDFDWSNAKKEWARAKPMNCEEMLVEQVQKTTEASPGTTVWVYRCVACCTLHAARCTLR